MTQISYDVCISSPNAATEKFVLPVFDAAYIIRKGEFRPTHLRIVNHEDSHRNWLMSQITIVSLEDEFQFLLNNPDKSPVMTRQVIHNQVVVDKNVYEKYIQSLFSSIRCGWENAEMILKLYGHFGGAEWGESQYLLGGIIDTCTPERPLLRCKIEPLYATIQSILPPFEVKRKKKWDVTTWKPKDSMNYQVVWHVMVTLSNGEKHPMEYPICSLNKWHDTMKQYFVEHSHEMFSPNHYTCTVTNHANGYRYEEIRERLQFFEDLTVGVYPSEILLKLAAFFNYSDKATHLQTILTGKEVELVFSGKVNWL